MIRVGWLFVVAALARGQPVPAPQTVPQPVFRSGASLVEVDAIVMDDRGRFVPGLTREDFELFDNDVAQPIQTFALVTAPRAGAAVPPEAAAHPVPQAFVLFIDDDHMLPGSFRRLQQAAIAFLRREVRPGDLAGVVADGRMLGDRLTSDREMLIAAVKAAQPGTESSARRFDLMQWPRLTGEAEAVRIANGGREELRVATERACAEDPALCRRTDLAPYVMEKAQAIAGQVRRSTGRTISALRALAAGLERVPGRKAIVLMTDGFLSGDFNAEIRAIVAAAARSHVRFYAIDARGTDVHGQSGRAFTPFVTDPFGGAPIEVYDSSTDAPNALAVDTGGFVARHTNDFAGALRRIAEDSGSYYVLGYAAPDDAPRGEFRRIAVKVRRPDVRVRARRGYLAGAAGTTLSDPGTMLSDADSTAVTSTPLAASPLRARVDEPPHAGAPELTRVATLVEQLRQTPQRSGSPAGAVRAAPDATVDAARRGWSAYARGDVTTARTELKAAVAAGAPPWAYYVLGLAELALGDANAAEAAWRRVRDAVPEFKAVYFDLADAYLRLRDPGSAVATLRRAQARWPGDAELLDALGVAQARREAYDAAIQSFARAIELAPGDPTGYFNLARAYEMRWARSRRYLKEQQRWVEDVKDRERAIRCYERYLALGGPHANQARDSLARLTWKTP